MVLINWSLQPHSITYQTTWLFFPPTKRQTHLPESCHAQVLSPRIRKRFLISTHPFTKKTLINIYIKLWFKHTNLPSSIKWGKKDTSIIFFHSSLSFKGASNRSKKDFLYTLFQLPQQAHWPPQQLPVLLSDLSQTSPKPSCPFNPEPLLWPQKDSCFQW